MGTAARGPQMHPAGQEDDKTTTSGHCSPSSRTISKLHEDNQLSMREFNYILIPKYLQRNNALLLHSGKQLLGKQQGT